jgi:hypothetical protein
LVEWLKSGRGWGKVVSAKKIFSILQIYAKVLRILINLIQII